MAPGGGPCEQVPLAGSGLTCLKIMGSNPLRQETPMTIGTVSRLRQRMIEDMTIRRFGDKTKTDYVRTVRGFAAFLRRSPDLAEPEDLRRCQLHLASRGASPAKMNAAVSALRF